MFHEGEAVTDSFGMQDDGVVEIGVRGVGGAACVKERFAGVEEEGDVEIVLFAGFAEGDEFFAVVADVVGAVFGSHEIETWGRSGCIS